MSDPSGKRAYYLLSRLLLFIITLIIPLLSFTATTQAANGNAPPAAAKTLYSDVSANNPNLPFIIYISQKGIIQGNPDGTYHPSAGLTRAEAATVICRTARLSPVSINKSPFKDLAINHWAAGYIEAAVKAGYLKGYPDNTFKPEASMTRAEGVSLVMRLCTQKDRAPVKELSDMKKDYWAAGDISTALALEMIGLSKDGTQVYPSAIMSRGSLARALAILLTKDPGLNAVKLEGKLSGIKGEVSLIRDGKSAAAQENGPLYQGDIIKTGEKSSVEINYPDGSSDLLEANSEISIKQSAGRSYIKQDGSMGVAVEYLNLDMKKGTIFGALATEHASESSKKPTGKESSLGLRLAARDSFNYLAAAEEKESAQPWYKTAEQKKVKVKVDMPWGVAAIRGTYVKISVNQDGTCQVACLTGNAELSSNSSSQTVPITGGQASNISQAAQPASAATTMSGQDKQDFSNHQDWVVNTALQQDVNQEVKAAAPVVEVIISVPGKNGEVTPAQVVDNAVPEKEAAISAEQKGAEQEKTSAAVTAVEVVVNALQASGIELKAEVIENLRQQIEQIQNQVQQETSQQLQQQLQQMQSTPAASPTTSQNNNQNSAAATGGGSSNNSSDTSSTPAMNYNTTGSYGPADGTTRLTLTWSAINGDNITMQNMNILGNLTVNNPGAILRNITVSGSLLLASGIGSGDVSLNNVTVRGNTVVNGGGSNSIDIENSSLASVEVNKENVHIVAGGSSSIANMTLNVGASLETLSSLSGGGFVSISTGSTLPSGSCIILKGSFNNLAINGSGCTVELAAGSSLQNLTANAPASIGGAGNIVNAVINVAGISLAQAPANMSLAGGFSASIAGQTVSSGSLSGSAGLITGRVVNSSSQPIAGAGVEIKGTSNRAITNSSGIFLIGGLSAGSYSLTITPPSGASYTSVTVNNLTVSAGQICRVSPDIILPALSGEAGLVNLSLVGNAGSPITISLSNNTYTASVAYAVYTATVSVTVSPGALWKLYDASNNEIADNTMRLNTGDNRAYIQVTAANGSGQTYNICLTKQVASSNNSINGVDQSVGSLIANKNTVAFAKGTSVEALIDGLTLPPNAQAAIIDTSSGQTPAGGVNVTTGMVIEVTAEDGGSPAIYKLASGIFNLEDLAAINYNLGDQYILTCDLDFTNPDSYAGATAASDKLVWADSSGNGWTPIGYDAGATNGYNPFTGSLDGNGHTIAGLHMKTQHDNTGLFSALKGSGQLANLNLTGVDISEGVSNCSFIGGLAGLLDVGSRINNSSVAGSVYCPNSYVIGGIVGYMGSGLIESCTSSADVSGNSSVGGICGNSEICNAGDPLPQIRGCLASGAVGGTGANADIGGITGGNHNGVISGCTIAVTANVSGCMGVGGICGSNLGGTITDCQSNGTVVGPGNPSTTIGGIVGRNDSGLIAMCSAAAAVSGKACIGGICGTNIGTIQDCLNTGPVTGNTYVGGIAGWNDNCITRTYANANIKGDDYVGGLVGKASAPISYSLNLSSIITVTGTHYGEIVGDGSTYIECYSQSMTIPTYQQLGWDIGTSSSIWVIANGPLPTLRQPDPSRPRLAQVTNIEWQVNADKFYISWNTVPNASSYKWQLFKEGLLIDSGQTGISAALFELSSVSIGDYSSKNYIIILQAMGDGINYMNGLPISLPCPHSFC